MGEIETRYCKKCGCELSQETKGKYCIKCKGEKRSTVRKIIGFGTALVAVVTVLQKFIKKK